MKLNIAPKVRTRNSGGEIRSSGVVASEVVALGANCCLAVEHCWLEYRRQSLLGRQEHHQQQHHQSLLDQRN